MHAKLQHYVPQVYLRNFATKVKKGHFINGFDKFTRQDFKTNVKNVASQTKFYDFTDSNENEVSFEDAFNEIESDAGKAFRSLIAQPKMSTLQLHKETLAYFFAIQDSRTQAFRDAQNDMMKIANQKLAKHGVAFPEETEDQEKEFQVRFLIDTSNDFANILLGMKWILLINKTNKPFWTSDNPIMKHNPIKSEFQGNLGLMCEGIQLQIPISPQIAIIICDPYGYSHEPDEASVTDIQNVDFNNSGQLVQSKQHVFSVENDFQIARKWINENPNAYDPNRPRVIDGSEWIRQNQDNQQP